MMTISQLRSQSLRREKEDPLPSVQEHPQLHIKVGHDNSEMRVKNLTEPSDSRRNYNPVTVDCTFCGQN
jgi:hypothetical protein